MNNSQNKSCTADDIKSIELSTVERYSQRYQKFGSDPKTLGWDTKRSQFTRFQAVTALINLNNKSVLDIGCGFADFYRFLRDTGVNPASYLGIDINTDLLKEAQNSFPHLKFDKRNLISETYNQPVADMGIMLGVLNFHLKDTDNYKYSKKMIQASFSAVREGLIVDFLSTYRSPDYPKESFVFYHEPEQMFQFALSLTSNVILKHDYPLIPQKEFMLFLRK